MFESLVANVLNKVLGDYVANLETQQLNVGIWGGDVKLQNLLLKREALEKFNLPIDIKEGYLGELILKIPWNNLKGAPVQIMINNLFVLAGPKADTEYDEKKEEELEHKRKQELLETFEMLAVKPSSASPEDSKSASFTTQLITKIVDNVQISISNIHMRYEDNISNPERPFAVGLTLAKLSAISAGDDWTEAYIQEAADGVRKLLSLDSLAFYFKTNASSIRKDGADFNESFLNMIGGHEKDSQYILKPVSATGRVKINKFHSSETAKTASTFQFDELAITLDDEQLQATMYFVAYIHFYMRRQQYKKFRPSLNVKPSDNPKAWFRYAGNCIVNEIHEKRKTWSWGFFEKRRQDRIKYVKLYVKSKLGLPEIVAHAELEEIEKKLSLKDIKYYRSIAVQQLKKERAKLAPKVAAVADPATTGRGGWLSGWWGRGGEAAPTGKPQLSDEELSFLYSTIDYDESADVTDIPKDALVLSAQMQLKSGSLVLKSRPHQENKELMIMRYYTFVADVVTRPDSMNAKVVLNGFEIQDCTPNTLYPVIAKVGDGDVSSPFFFAEFERNPLDKHADAVAIVRMRNIQFVYNPRLVEALIRFFYPPVPALESVAALIDAAGEKFQDFAQQTRAALQYALDQHKTMDIKLDVDAPIFIIPESCFEQNTNVLVIDSGHVHISSDLVETQHKEQFRSLQGKVLSQDELLKLQDLMYDKFDVSLTNVQALLGTNLEECLQLLKVRSQEDDRHILKRLDLQVKLESCILPNAPNLTSLKLNGRLPTLSLNVSDEKYKLLMRIIALLNPQTATADGAPIDLPKYEPLPWEEKKVDDLFLDSDTESNDDDDATFYDAEDTLNIRQKKGPDPNKRNIEFAFVVDLFTMSMKRAAKNELLAEFRMNNFGLSFVKRPYDMAADVVIRSIYVQNFIEPEREYIFKSEARADSLVKARYAKTEAYLTSDGVATQALTLDVAALKVMVSSKSILTFQDFLISTFTSSGPSPSPAQQTKPVDQPAAPSMTKVDLKMEAMIFVLATGQVEFSHVSVEKMTAALHMSNKMLIGARIGNFSITDNTNADKEGKVVGIEGGEVVNFRYETFCADDWPGYDSSVSLSTGAVVFTALEAPLSRMFAFANEFMETQAMISAARRAATQSATQLQQQVSRMQLDVAIKSPVVVLPIQGRDDAIVAYLGSLSFNTAFVPDSLIADATLNKMDLTVQNIRVSSTFFSEPTTRQQPILDDLNFGIHLAQSQPFKRRPEYEISMDMTNITVGLTKYQYNLLLDFAASLQRITSSSSTTTIADRSIENSLTTPIATSDNSTVEAALNGELSKLDLSFDLPKIDLELFSDDVAFEANNSLSYFGLDRLSTSFHMRMNSSFDAEFVIMAFILRDTRASNKHFTELIHGPKQDDPQFIVSCNRTADLSTAISVTIDTPQVILIPQHLTEIRLFLSSPSSLETPPPPPPANSGTGVNVDPYVQEASLAIRLNIVDVEIAVLENVTNPLTEALVFSVNQILLTKQRIMALSINQMGMFLCRMDSRESTLTRLIDNVDLALSLDMQSTEVIKRTSLDLNMKPLIFRISYRDVLLIQSILMQLQAITSTPVPAKSSGSTTVVPRSAIDVTNGGAPQVLPVEEIKADFDGIEWIFIDDAGRPVLDFQIEKFSIAVADWSNALTVSTCIPLCVNYFNLKNSHWEPLLEPWKFSVMMKKDPVIDVTFSSEDTLNLNVTHAFVETSLATASSWTKITKDFDRDSHLPYLIRNRTGYTLQVCASGMSEAPQQILDGKDQPWRFDDWRKMRETTVADPHTLNVQLLGTSWQPLNDILVDQENNLVFKLDPPVQGTCHRLICGISIVNNVKNVTFSSSLSLENLTTVTLELALLSGNLPAIKTIKIPPGGSYYLPVEKVKTHNFRLRPDGGRYKWCNEILGWTSFTKESSWVSIIAKSVDKSQPNFHLQAHNTTTVNPTTTTASTEEEYPFMKLCLSAPVELENLLPYDFKCRIVDRNLGQEFSSVLKAGTSSQIHLVQLGHLLLMSVEIPDTDFEPSEFAIIESPDLDEVEPDNFITLYDRNKQKLRLKLARSGNRAALKISVYSKYILLNKTGLELSYRSKSFLHSSKLAPGQGSYSRVSRSIKPFLFSFPHEDANNSAQVQVPQFDWSSSINFDTSGTISELVLSPLAGNEEAYLGYEVSDGEGKFRLSKVITFCPRFIIVNKLDRDLAIREINSSKALTVSKGSKFALLFLQKESEKQLHFRFPGLDNRWSSAFKITDLGKVYLKVYRAAHEIDLLRVDVQLEKSVVFITVREEKGPWPFRIENGTDVAVTISQQNTTADKNQPPPKFVIEPTKDMLYSWDYPSAPEKQLVVNVNGRERDVNLLEIGPLVPFKYLMDGQIKIMAMEIKADGPTQVLKLSPYDPSDSIYRPRPTAATEETFEAETRNDVVLMLVKLRLVEGLGISFISRKMKEIVYISLKDLDVEFKDTAFHQSVKLQLRWIELDNQLFGAIYPIVLYPTIIPRKKSPDTTHPAVHLAVVKVKDTSHGVQYFKYFSILLQEISFEMDEDLLYELIDFGRFNQSLLPEKQEEGFVVVPDIKEPQDVVDDSPLYFELMHVQPMKLNFSFVRTNALEGAERQPSNPLAVLMDVFTITLGNVNEAPLRMNALIFENLRTSPSVLTERLKWHYEQEVLLQVYKIIGAADIIGNPVGLFSNISSGVADIFYEPYQGFIMSDRPQDIGIGLVKGAASFLKKTVFGLTDSVSRFTGSLGKGLSAATFDPAFQARRRIAYTRNKPRHALAGVTQGASSLASSLVSGVSGVVVQPFMGAESEGVMGFFKGVGKGLVGAVTKPVVGLVDLATNVTEGIKNTTTVFDEAGELDRIRVPRFVDEDGILRAYSQREALGQQWLMETEDGVYASDRYKAHIDVRLEESVVIATNNRLLCVSAGQLNERWSLLLSDIASIEETEQGLIVRPNRGAQAQDIHLANKNSAQWFKQTLEDLLSAPPPPTVTPTVG